MNSLPSRNSNTVVGCHACSWRQVVDCCAGVSMTLLVALTTLLVATRPGASEHLQFDGGSFDLARGWVLFSSHLVHFGGEHLFWDLAVFTGIGVLLERLHRRLFAWTVFISAVMIPPLAVAGSPGVSTYCGLSGIDTALFAALATHQLIVALREKSPQECLVCSLLLLAMMGKSLFELASGSTLFVTDSHFVPLPAAHVAGALIGSAMAVAAGIRQ